MLNSNSILYSFSPTQFQSYFNGFYGIDAYTNFLSIHRNADRNNLGLYGYSIFSPEWTRLYGKSFDRDVETAYNKGIVTDYSFISDFQCSDYENLINNNGRITQISENKMMIDMNGKSYELRLGACSRLNGVNQYYPQVGNQISWRGVNSYDNIYNIHTATCY